MRRFEMSYHPQMAKYRLPCGSRVGISMIAALGCDAVELHALCAVLIIIRLSLGGENEAVVVLIPLAGKSAVIFTADIVALLVAAYLGKLAEAVDLKDIAGDGAPVGDTVMLVVEIIGAVLGLRLDKAAGGYLSGSVIQRKAHFVAALGQLDDHPAEVFRNGRRMDGTHGRRASEPCYGRLLLYKIQGHVACTECRRIKTNAPPKRCVLPYHSCFLSLVKSTELMSAVSGTDRITPMLLDMPLTTSIARYDELSS